MAYAEHTELERRGQRGDETMSRVRVVLWQVEDDEAGERETEVGRFELPGMDLAAVAPGTALDVIEERTHQTGQAILRRVMQAQWEAADAAAVAAHRRLSPPADLAGRRDG